jgi:hypothetical protein
VSVFGSKNSDVALAEVGRLRNKLRGAHYDFELVLKALENMEFDEGEGCNEVRCWECSADTLRSYADAKTHATRGKTILREYGEES